MAMWASSDFHKRTLNYLTSSITIVTICSSQPATPVDAYATAMLAKTSAASRVGAPGSTTDGWTVSVSSAAALAVGSSGGATHIALLATTAMLAYVTTCTLKNLTTADTVSMPAWNIRVGDPTSS